MSEHPKIIVDEEHFRVLQSMAQCLRDLDRVFVPQTIEDRALADGGVHPVQVAGGIPIDHLKATARGTLAQYDEIIRADRHRTTDHRAEQQRPAPPPPTITPTEGQ